MHGSFEVVQEQDVLLLRLTRPAVRNALDVDLVTALTSMLRDAAEQRHIRACVLTGSGGNFCAGGDLTALDSALRSESLGQGVRHVVEAVHELIEVMEDLPFSTVAAIEGAVAGAGIGLAGACDVRYGSPTSQLVAGFIRLGISPDSGTTHRLPRLVGEGVASEWLLRNVPVPAHELLTRGFLQAVVERPEDHAMDVARHMPHATGDVVRQTRQLLRTASQNHLRAHLQLEAEAVERTALEPEFRTRVAAYFGLPEG